MTNTIKQKTKYSGVEWFGNVPQDWQVKKLKFVFKYFTGGTPDSGKDKYYSEDGFNWITITDLDGKFTSESKNKITELAVQDKNMKIVPIGSLLYSFKLSVGQMAFVSKETYTNEAIFAILPDKNINLDFWYYALQSYLIENANENIYGAKIFNQSLIDNSILLVPPPSIQKGIGEYLDIKTEEIKKFIDDKKKLISLLEEQKKTVIHNAVTKGIDNKIKIKPSGVDWLGDIPKDWGVLKLKHAVKLNVHKTVDQIDKNIALENIEGWKGKLIETEGTFEGEGNLFKKGDVLFGKLRPYLGKVYLSEYSGRCVNEILVFTPNENILNSEYLYYLCSSSEFIKIVDSSTYGSKMPRAEWDFIGKMEVPIPNIETQEEIVNHIKTDTQKIDRAIHTVQQEIELIEEYKKSLIYQAVTGKIETLLTNK